MNILAMDLGKNKTVFCEYESETAEHKFGKVKTSPKQIHDMLVEKAPDKIVFEICSAAGWIYDIADDFLDFLTEKQVFFSVFERKHPSGRQIPRILVHIDTFPYI